MSNLNDLLVFSNKKPVPMILQSETSDCGLAVLAMISSYYKHRINLGSLRKRSPNVSQGMTLKQMIELANEINLSSRALKCTLEEITNLQLPCILHWDLDHFVVLTGIKKTRKKITFSINDPAFGKREIDIKEFSKSFTGIVLELTPTSEFVKKDSRETLKINQLWQHIYGLKRTLATLFILSIILQISALLYPYYMQWVIDNVLLSNDRPMLMVLAIGFTSLLFIQTCITVLRSWLVVRFNSSLSVQMGANLFQHLIRLPLQFFEKRHIGDIVSRFNSLGTIREQITTDLIEAIIDGIMSLTVIIVMYIYSPTLAVVILCIMIISFLIQLAFFYPIRRITEEEIASEAKEDSNFIETIKSIQILKIFGEESNRSNFWLNSFASVINNSIKLKRLNISQTTTLSLLFGIESILTIYLGALSVIDGTLTVGMLVSFIAYKGQFISNMNSLIDKLLLFKMLDLHLERISDIALQDKETNSNETLCLPTCIKGHIKLENISYRYSDNTDWVLYNVSFEIFPGESIAITGASGTGKTTLLKIILGLIPATSGSVFLDGVNINNISLSEYRKHFAAVMQNDSLLSGTIAENITMFSNDYNEPLLINCCKNACIWSDIENMPLKTHTLVGDMGNSFSGGQLQRLYLARALYKQPKILCLDESTSHLDSRNELWINKNIAHLKMTRIIIAHRKETIASADREISLDQKFERI